MVRLSARFPILSQWSNQLWRAGRASLALLGLLQIGVTFTPLTKWWVKALAGKYQRPKGDVLIVLGGDIYSDGTIGVHSYWRCMEAAAAYRQAGFREILVTGGGGFQVAIAEPIRKCMIDHGVPAERIRVEVFSNSTRENALRAKAMLGSESGRIALLSSDIHMFRARHVFAKLGMEVVPVPTVDVARSTYYWLPRWSAFLDLSLESTKIVYYYARGWI